jgi:hypothetical protein
MVLVVHLRSTAERNSRLNKISAGARPANPTPHSPIHRLRAREKRERERESGSKALCGGGGDGAAREPSHRCAHSFVDERATIERLRSGAFLGEPRT